MMYPMPMAPYGHNTGGMAYGMPYPAYPPYAIPQHPGPVQHGTHYQPHGTQMQNLSPGQISPYGSGYYPHSPYPAPYGHGILPVGPMPQTASPIRTNTSSPTKPGSLRKEVDKRMADLEYDVSKTIVDGSNPMKLVPQPQPLLSGELFFFFPFPSPLSRTSLLESVSNLQFIQRQIPFATIPDRSEYPTRTTPKTKAIRPCALGWKPSPRRQCRRSQGSFLTRRNTRHRKCVPDFQE